MRLKSISFFVLLLLSACFVFAQKPTLVLPVAHTNRVSSATFSPDGKKVVTAGDNTARIWDVQSGKMLQTFVGHKFQVLSATFSPDGKRIVTASDDNTARIWDAQSGKILQTFEGHTKLVFSATFSPDGKRIVTASHDRTARIWDAQSGKILQSFVGHTDYVRSATFSGNGKRILTASWDKTAILWDAQSGAILHTLKGHRDIITSATFSPDGKWILTASADKTTRIWDAKTGAMFHALKGHRDMVSSATFSPDGKRVVTSSWDSTAKIWDAQTGAMLHTLKGHTRSVGSATFSPDGKWIVTASLDGTARTWDVLTGTMLHTLMGHTFWVSSATFSPDGKRIVTASDDYTASIWDVQSGAMFYTLKGHAFRVTSAMSSPDGKKIVTASEDKIARIWDAQSGVMLHPLEGHTSWVYSAVFSPDGEKVVTAGDSTVRIWDAESGKMLKKLVGHRSDVRFAAFSPDGKWILTASEDQTAKIWDAQNGRVYNTFRGHTNWVYAAIFSPDGKKIVTASGDHTARIWDVQSGTMLHVLKGHVGSVTSIMFSADGRRLVTASWDSTARIWDAQSGALLHTLRGHTNFVNLATFSPDGKRIVTASPDGTVRTWDAQSGQFIQKNYDIDGILQHIHFGTNNMLVSAASETSVLNFSTGKHLYSFYALDSSDYFSQIPSGYYMASPRATKLLHYVTNDLRVITFEQLDIKYNRPDLVLKTIGNTDTALINSYRRAWEKRIKKLGIDTTQFRDNYSVPEADFVNRNSIAYEQTNGTLRLTIKGFGSTYKLDRFNIWVNEVPLFGQKGISIRWRNSNRFDTTVTIQLSDNENRIETSVTNVNGTESYRIPLYVKYTPKQPAVSNTYFIGIGINRFRQPKHDLQWCVKDIHDLALQFKQKYASSIIIDTLLDEQVTLANVQALKKKLLQTGINDRVIIAYSGHGLLSKSYDYYLSAYDVNFKRPEENGIPYEVLEDILDGIPARKKLLLLDACHSGEVDKDEMLVIQDSKNKTGNTGLVINRGSEEEGETQTTSKTVGLQNSFELMQSLFVNVGKGTGATIISAAGGVQFAQERDDLANGVFTFSLLEVLNQYKSIKVSQLKKIVGERVEQLTNGLQKPTARNELKDFDWEVW